MYMTDNEKRSSLHSVTKNFLVTPSNCHGVPDYRSGALCNNWVPTVLQLQDCRHSVIAMQPSQINKKTYRLSKTTLPWTSGASSNVSSKIWDVQILLFPFDSKLMYYTVYNCVNHKIKQSTVQICVSIDLTKINV